MTHDHNDLRKMAQAARATWREPWFRTVELPVTPVIAAYIAVFSPDVVIGLLDEIERLRAQLDQAHARHEDLSRAAYPFLSDE